MQNSSGIRRAAGFISFFLVINATSYSQQVSEVITSFSGFWRSGVSAPNPIFPNTSHNLVSFKYNSVTYSTGVNNTLLNDSNVAYTPAHFAAFPVATVGGVVSGPVYIALASRYDGIPVGYSNPFPSVGVKDALIDGVQGLDLGTGVTNIPASALINFPLSNIIHDAISDAQPDILLSQIADPSSGGDTLFFVNSAGTLVGNKIKINWTQYSRVGTYYLDLYSLPTGALCDTAKISGTNSSNVTREIRMIAFKLSEFGITAGNAATVTQFFVKASGSSDPAFIAYNTDAFTIPSPVITVHPASRIVCPNMGNNTTLNVTATGGGLRYQWRKNGIDIAGATNPYYIISNVVDNSAGSYQVVVTNTAGSVASNLAFVNISVAVQPSPSSRVIATGANTTLTVTANNATSYQWKRNALDIPGATSPSYTLSPVTSYNAGTYTVQILNSAGSGCANILSNGALVIAATTLYSKPALALNLPSTWGIATDGSGSSPLDFSRPEHTFIVKNNAVTGGDLTIAGILDMGDAVTTVSANTTLDAERVIRSGTGALSVSASSNITLRGSSTLFFQTGASTLKNLTIYGGNITLLNALSIAAGSSPGTLTLNGGTLITGNNLSFKSDALGTARLAQIYGGGTIDGKATIERYVPMRNAWRLLAAPVKATNAPTINQAWQEGLTSASSNPNLYPGFGVVIQGGTVANGYDLGLSFNPSIKVLNNAAGTFVGLPANPGTNVPISNYPGYFLFIRGDRSINLMAGNNSGSTPTTLRIKGEINTGSVETTVHATGYTVFGNPYPSAINFETLTKNNVKNSFYVWDPKLAGSYGLGAYVTFSFNEGSRVYDATSSASPLTKYIASGEAVIIESLDGVNAGTITVKESDKTANGSDFAFGRSNGLNQHVRVNFYANNADGSRALLDGVLTSYDDDFMNEVDYNDAKKLSGASENIALKRGEKMLAIERRKSIADSDTSFLNIYQLKIANYSFEISANNMGLNGTTAVIRDNYSNSINDTPLDLNGTVTVPFSVTNDPGSYARGRFSIVFRPASVLPVTFHEVKASRQHNKIKVEWLTGNETNLKEYAVERSAENSNFSVIKTAPATATTGGAGYYSYDDMQPLAGNNYYRIISVDVDGKRGYSKIVKVNMPALAGGSAIEVFPNPAETRTISIRFKNIEKGNYNLALVNALGQVLETKNVQYEPTSGIVTFEVKEQFTPGKYELILAGNGTRLVAPVIRQ